MNAPSKRLLHIAQVEQKIGFRRNWIYNRIKKGLFPKGTKIAGTNAWQEQEIDEWIDQQFATEKAS